MIPRTEVMAECVLCLLNLRRKEFLISFNKPWTYIEIASAISLACQDIAKIGKTDKKITNKDIWDLSMFYTFFCHKFSLIRYKSHFSCANFCNKLSV